MSHKVLRIVDRWNPHKAWLVKRYACGHFYLSQEVNGVRLYPFTRQSRYRVSEVTWCTTSELKALLKEQA